MNRCWVLTYSGACLSVTPVIFKISEKVSATPSPAFFIHRLGAERSNIAGAGRDIWYVREALDPRSPRLQYQEEMDRYRQGAATSDNARDCPMTKEGKNEEAVR